MVRIILLAMLYITSTYATSSPNTMQLADCFVFGVKSQAKCGTLSVAENRSKPQSEDNQINMNVVVLPKFKEESKAYPLFFLAGGPGQAATELAGVINATLSEVRQQHDIVLIDQRGTGKSNALECPMDEIDSLVFEDASIDWKHEVEKCLNQINTKNLSSYSTYDAVEDFEAVRKALGYEKVHLYGGSYGTRSGFAYLKNHPNSIESAILDSNAPMELIVGFFGQTGQAAFELLLTDCKNHQKCNESFPDLKQDYLKLISQLEQKPYQQEIFHPVSGEKLTVNITKKKVVEAVRAALYDLGSRQSVPYVINAAANGDFRSIAVMISASSEPDKPGKLYIGLTMNIICNEDIPRATEQDFVRDRDNYFSGELGYTSFTDICEYWPNWQAPSNFAEPVTADVPVLLFSGKYDPVTPPQYGEMALKSLPNAKHVVIENGSHVASLRMCADTISQFLTNSNFEQLDVECAEQEKTMMFFTDVNRLH